MNEKRIIKTNLTGKKANEILSSVIGQMSDGMFENSTYYEGYWRFVDIDDSNNICVDTNRSKYSWYGRDYKNKFYHMSDIEIKRFFAKLIKRIAQEELRDNGIPVRGQFKEGNNFLTKYLSYYEHATIGDCVTVYNTLVMMKGKLTLIDRWDDLTTGERYMEIKIGKYEACCVKELEILQFDGKEVYSDVGGADYPLRKLPTDEYKEIINFAKEQYEKEKEMDKKYCN